MPWVLQAHSNIVDPNLTYDDFLTLDERLKLAPGWKSRVKVPDQDLTIQAMDHRARIVHDDLENTYDACFDTACSWRIAARRSRTDLGGASDKETSHEQRRPQHT